jgi:hypothetical protein
LSGDATFLQRLLVGWKSSGEKLAATLGVTLVELFTR